MSRIIVKNLPKGTKEDTLRQMFSQKGDITDLSMKYTKEGVFRNFAFIGFKTTQNAQEAIQHFDKTFYNSARIQVELAKDFGDKTKPRAWSKYTQATEQKGDPDEGKEKQLNKRDKADRRKKAKEDKMKEILGDLGEDPEFKEFLEVHHQVSKKAAWSDDVVGPTAVTSPDKHKTRTDVMFDGDESSDDESEDDVEESPKESKGVETPTTSNALSDLEYLKSKMTTSDLLSDSDESGFEDVESEPMETSTTLSKKDNSGKDVKKTKVKKEKPRYVMKISSLQGMKYTEKIFKEFFQPLNTKSVKIARNSRKNLIGVAYVEFSSDKDLEQALRVQPFMNGKKIIMKRSGDVADAKVSERQPRPWELKILAERTVEDEGIAETGRLFVRNLAYCCTEEDLEEMFKKFGPLTEVNVPVDKFTKKMKGYAQVTFMMPEHAVKAFVELDGTVFQGRMIHILPGKPKTEEMESTEKSSFKKKKELEQKVMSKSSHNWNSLFLGANAVAGAMAERYATTKSQILDSEGKESLGVRMALGETQIVAETRDFLTENGVSLDCFSQAAAPRSKCVILAKNLPAGTSEYELREKFEPHGMLGRLLLPPAGVSALIEFLEPSEARTAFTKLAYTKFHHLPLYLEWAPMGVFTTEYKKPEEEEESEEEEEEEKKKKENGGQTGEGGDVKEKKTQEPESESEDEQEAKPGCTLFVKNLNFDTSEDDLHALFSKCGKVKNASISKKKDFKDIGKMLSMGYGFVEYKKKSSADKALKTLQHTTLDEHQLELKVSHRATRSTKQTDRKKQTTTKQKSSKILVRNIPFEATKKEMFELFRVFGELKTVRLPKKMSGTGSHRGFGFVDFLTRHDAKRAFNALCHSTHLYGRRLVLEWAEAEDTIDDLRRKTAERFHTDVPSKKLKKSAIMEDLSTS